MGGPCFVFLYEQIPARGALIALDLTHFAPVEAASSSLPATFQKENTILTDGVSFCDYPQVLSFAPSHIARKGECVGETFAGFPTRVQSSARRRHFCTAKVPHQKRRGTRTCVSSFLVRAMGLEPTRPYGHKHLKLACLPIPARSRTRYLTIIAKPGSLSSTGGKFACCR